MRVLRGIGALFLLLALIFGLLTVASWPPEGLFFGLPFFFLMPALLLGIGGGVLWLCTRPSKTLPPSEKGKDLQ